MVADTSQVTGDAGGVRAQGRNWGMQAQAADGRLRQLQSSASAVGIASFTGPAADRTRGFLSELGQATAGIAEAYARVAAAAPRVADAIEDAKQAQQRRDTTRHAAEQARTALTAAEARYTAAVAAARAAAAASAVAQALTGTAAGAAAAQAAVAAARADLVRARAADDRARRTATAAQKAFDAADRSRDHLTRAFAALCHHQQAAVARALPNAPVAAPASELAAILGKAGTAKGWLKTPVDLQVGAVERYYERLAKSGAATPADTAFAASLSKWAGRVGVASTGASVVLPVVTSTLKALHTPGLTGDQRRDAIVNGALPGEVGTAFGFGAASACGASGLLAPVAPLCGVGAGTIASAATSALVKTKAGRAAVHFVGTNVVQPYVDGPEDIIHAHNPLDVVKGLGEMGTAPERVGLHVAGAAGKEAIHIVTNPGKDLHAVGGVIHSLLH